MGFKRGVNRGGNGPRRNFRSREEDDLVLTRGSHQSARKGGRRVPVRGFVKLGRGLASEAGPIRFPLAFLFIFLLSSFSLFCFLISFLDFAF
jgi:hypothetical protein